MYQSITEEAWELVHSLATQCISNRGLGSMSSAPYDTAWVAMIEKSERDGTSRPLFPEAYDYLKKTQSADGSWASGTSVTDGIINTLAALLALKKREKQPGAASADNEQRCRAAEDALHRMLISWDLDTTDRVGLEVLVPNLLKLLEAEGVQFDFPSRAPLMALNAVKLARLRPVITGPVQTTLIHTLEAFIGTLNFDKVRHHKMPNGSMLGSPSSTAAYLMNCSTWDPEAEAYLRMVFDHQSSVGDRGGFPSAFPSTLFETSWVMSTLLAAGFDKNDFLLADIRNLTELLETNLKSQGGIVGFAPSSLPDADDTAKTISALGYIGRNQNVQPMLKAFETDPFFITYRGERNPSTSANCNILTCLLRSPDSAKYTKQVVKCVQFLSDSWENNNGPDKWNTSAQYLMMLIAQSFTLFLQKWGSKELDMDLVPAKLIHHYTPRTLLDILSRTMREQQVDGSWESKREITAYAVLTLAPLLSLPWVDFMKSDGIASMYRGKAYLEINRSHWRDAERLWIEKTVYSSSNLAQAYCLAASKIALSPFLGSRKVGELLHPKLKESMVKKLEFFSQVGPFSKSPRWKLQLSLLQSVQYATTLQESRYDIFPRIDKASDERYQEYIPFTWIGCRDICSTGISSKSLWGMMLVSMLGFQVDAYMETVVWERYQGRLPVLKAFIRALCSGCSQKRNRDRDGYNELKETSKRVETPQRKSDGNKNTAHVANGVNGLRKSIGPSSTNTGVLDSGDSKSSRNDDSDVEETLTKFVYFVLHHPKVIESSVSLQAWLRHELQAYLLSHITHLEDDSQLLMRANKPNESSTWESPRTTFFNWVHTTSANSTSCSYAFVFFLCLIGESGKNFITNVHQRYALEDVCHHLAATVRQYNDFGSVARDQDEGNLNSINFPEFKTASNGEPSTEDLVGRRKTDLLTVAAYEKRCLDRVLGELESVLDARVMEKLRLFIQVTDLYGEIYVARDIGIRRTEASKRAAGVTA